MDHLLSKEKECTEKMWTWLAYLVLRDPSDFSKKKFDL